MLPLFRAALSVTPSPEQRDDPESFTAYRLHGMLNRILFDMPAAVAEELRGWTDAMRAAGRVIGVQCRRNRLQGDSTNAEFLATLSGAYERRVWECAKGLDDGQATFMLFYDDPGEPGAACSVACLVHSVLNVAHAHCCTLHT